MAAAHRLSRSPSPRGAAWWWAQASAPTLRLARLAGRVALGALLLLVAVVGIGQRLGRMQTATVLSGSMAPGIPTGSVVLVTPIPRSAVQVGDIITYRTPVGDHHLVTHRVVKVVKGGDQPVVVTRGDANSADDPWQARLTNGPVWKTRAHVPYLGRMLVWVHGRTGRLVTTVFLPLVVMAWTVRSWWRTERRPRRRPAHLAAA